MNRKKYHINVSTEDIHESKYCLICGDPARVPRISSLMSESHEISFNREYRVHLGYIDNQPVIVSSLGIGGPSTAIGIEEFGQLGVNTFIRVGTSGIISNNVKIGDIISATAAIRDEGTSQQYIDTKFPAVANIDVVMALRKAAENLNFSSKFHEGVIHTKDSFYTEIPNMIPDPYISEKWKMWKKAGALVTEMECSTLFVVCQIRGWKAGGILAAIGEMREEKLIINHKKGQKKTIAVAVEAVKVLMKNSE